MKRLFLFLFLASPALAWESVTVINSTNNPVNVTGHTVVDNSSFTVNTSSHISVDNFPVIQAVSVVNSSFSITGSTTNVIVDGVVPVSGTFFQAVQPVSLSSANVTGSTVNINGTVPVSGTFFQTTQPVSFTTPYPVWVATTSIVNQVSTFSLVNIATITFSGVSQPVTISNPFGNSSSTFTLVNVATVTFNNIAQPVTISSVSVSGSTVSISGFVNVTGATVTISNPSSGGGGSNSSSTFTIVKVATVTFNSISQPVNITNVISTFSLVNIATVTFNGIAQPVNVITSSFSVTGSTIAALQSGIWQVVPNRPSQGAGRTYKTGFLANLASNATAYTVTGGKTLFVTDLSLTGYNTSTAVAGLVRIQDGGTTRIPVSIPTAGVGALASQVPVSGQEFIFIEPQQYISTVNVVISSGTITYSMSFDGYEE